MPILIGRRNFVRPKYLSRRIRLREQPLFNCTNVAGGEKEIINDNYSLVIFFKMIPATQILPPQEGTQLVDTEGGTQILGMAGTQVIAGTQLLLSPERLSPERGRRGNSNSGAPRGTDSSENFRVPDSVKPIRSGAVFGFMRATQPCANSSDEEEEEVAERPGTIPVMQL